MIFFYDESENMNYIFIILTDTHFGLNKVCTDSTYVSVVVCRDESYRMV
jgi:hypothetical protein